MAWQASLLRYNGEDRETGEYHGHGYTALLDTVQAAGAEREAAATCRGGRAPSQHRGAVPPGVAGLPGLGLPDFSEAHCFDVFQNYVIRSRDRDWLRAHLTARGVETLVHWPKPMWAHPDLGLPDPHLPETERICTEVVSLPMSAETTPEQVEIVVAAIQEFAGGAAAFAPGTVGGHLREFSGDSGSARRRGAGAEVASARVLEHSVTSRVGRVRFQRRAGVGLAR